MPTLIDFRRRIRSVQNTQKITRAMKLVSAAKLRRAQERVFNARPYAGQMLEVLRSLARRAEVQKHPLLEKRPEEKVLVLVLSGDKGLCGPFNTNVFRLAERFLRAVDYAQARDIAAQVMELYTKKEFDAVYLIYNEFKSILAQRLITEKLLPIEGILPTRVECPLAVAGAPAAERPAEAPVAAAGETEVDYLYEQPPAELFDRLLPRHVEVQVYRALLESGAAQQAARMTALDAATNNPAEMIDRLTLHMNKVRQAGITRELIEIVSGAAAAL